MDCNRVEGNWKQLKGKIQEPYGYERDRARKDVDYWYGRQTW